jgi:hypothetical protein
MQDDAMPEMGGKDGNPTGLLHALATGTSDGWC